jgi:hypothetical protein
MQFEVNGISYFLNFNPSEGRWQLLFAMPKGVGRLAIFDDGGPLLVPTEVIEVPATEHAN